MNTLPAKYAGQYVALINHKIVANAMTQLEVYKKAKQIDSHRLITLAYVPTKKETITFL